ncbi:L-2-hydroxyglutarate dehydrogenase, mitochondrial isoform X2 [Eurytemora carolleeae]|uniref:L-2-hydroxyglutarate dehydrogenase, mitochondrial isoform X2 n=1 Tax=Eurytemora carolleeae TaxID=1294199 RepID=UPI000C790C3E|nr:L-2-hydroxyglutarate dehydrogenase, mitochondrial isoform X2 [Eurytemora carolleeae]XP_023339333.1 L-2-hydroxyglutarate dehydrogenase, mitochondrial isoform X2 [Eurytemora carolleeae]|eukprot:XP_023339332.1 L-2-hydroxyglutarate dehydrogenase, mitochondrial-like isoform X2 [Eurytemora affinis]
MNLPLIKLVITLESFMLASTILQVGKLVVATNELEEKRLMDLWERANLNQVPGIELVDSKGIQEREPACRGTKAIWSPHTGIVDWARVARHYGTVFKSRGGKIYTGFQASEFSAIGDTGVRIRSTEGKEVSCQYVLACTGLYADRVAELTGCNPEPKIVPFRGEYLLLSPEKSKLIRGNIYPVPDPRFPFLGVHFTPRMNGEVWLGPNAVLAMSREGYSWGQVNPRDLAEVLVYPGFYRLAQKYLGYGLDQMLGSIFIRRAVKELQKYVPQVEVEDISRGPAGVRAQAMNSSGNLVGDFIFSRGEGTIGARVLHCRNAPSPAATSSLAIAQMIVDKMNTEFNLNLRV